MNIAVYLGANTGSNPLYLKAVQELGTWIASKGHTLIYGGSKTGLMGELAGSALQAGGKVIGVEPEFFVKAVLQLEDLTELIVTQTMAERRNKMIELADCFIAFPGGVGTLDEISEVIALNSVGQSQKKFAYYNVNGFYDLTQKQYQLMLREGFLTKENYEKIKFLNNLDDLENFIASL